MSDFLRQFTIRTRMLGAIAMVLALLALVSGAGLFGLWRLDSIGHRFQVGTFADLQRVGKLQVALGNARRFEKDVLMNAGNGVAASDYMAKWKAAVSEASAQASAIAGSGQKDDGTQLAGQVLAGLTDYAAKAEPVLRKVQSGEGDAASANRDLAPAKTVIRAGEELMTKLGEHMASESVRDDAERRASVHQAYVLLGVAIGVAVLLVVPLTIANMNSLCRPIEQAKALAEKIAAGDLTGTATATGADEAAALQRSLAAMQESLRTMVGQVRASTDSIGTASTEIATGNQDLSARTEQTASNLQQAASSMTQLTATVNQSADAARQANQLAASAADVAQRGGTVVAQVVSTMDEINASSKKIADIIGVIDGIAFQTNILALNAAVEAARAGEQGRGFAVVASEVRALAQRSAGAAKEIKSLIGTSVDKVESGSKLVADAGATMNEIVASVQRVSDIIGEITAAASEQSDGIGQVNTAVGHLDQMTQQNAALVEQSAAAAESLKDQALALARVVSGFQLDTARTPAAVRAEPTAAPARPAPPSTPTPPPAPTAAAPRPAPAAPRAAAPAPVAAPAAAGSMDEWETF